MGVEEAQSGWPVGVWEGCSYKARLACLRDEKLVIGNHFQKVVGPLLLTVWSESSTRWGGLQRQHPGPAEPSSAFQPGPRVVWSMCMGKCEQPCCGQFRGSLLEEMGSSGCACSDQTTGHEFCLSLHSISPCTSCLGGFSGNSSSYHLNRASSRNFQDSSLVMAFTGPWKEVRHLRRGLWAAPQSSPSDTKR